MQIDATDALLNEIDRLRAALDRARQDLSQAHQRERITVEVYSQQQSSYRELEALYQAMTERALVAEHELAQMRCEAPVRADQC